MKIKLYKEVKLIIKLFIYFLLTFFMHKIYGNFKKDFFFLCYGQRPKHYLKPLFTQQHFFQLPIPPSHCSSLIALHNSYFINVFFLGYILVYGQYCCCCCYPNGLSVKFLLLPAAEKIKKLRNSSDKTTANGWIHTHTDIRSRSTSKTTKVYRYGHRDTNAFTHLWQVADLSARPWQQNIRYLGLLVAMLLKVKVKNCHSRHTNTTNENCWEFKYRKVLLLLLSTKIWLFPFAFKWCSKPNMVGSIFCPKLTEIKSQKEIKSWKNLK